MRTPIDVGVSGCVGRSPESGETSYQDRREQGQRGLAGGLHPGPDSHRRIDRRRLPRSGLTSVPGHGGRRGRRRRHGAIREAGRSGPRCQREKGEYRPQHHRPFSSTRPVIHRPTSRGRRRGTTRRAPVPEGSGSGRMLSRTRVRAAQLRFSPWLSCFRASLVPGGESSPGRSGTTPGRRWLSAGGLQEAQPLLAAFARGPCPVTSDPRGRATRERAVRWRGPSGGVGCRCGEGQRITEREVRNVER